MASNLKIVDEATTVALINDFQRATDDTETAHGAVSSTQAELAGSWRGVASGQFGNSLAEWMSGLTKVKGGLEMLNEGMVTFSKSTASTEDDAAALASQVTVSASWT